MKGKYNIVIYDNKIKYDIEIERNITIIKGKSGTGKSTLFQMFDDLLRSERDVGVHCNCRDKLITLHENSDWKNLIQNNSGKIFIADEYVDYITWLDFAKVVQESDNYFIFISRTGRLKWLTYSVKCIYTLDTKKVGNISVTRLYNKYFDNAVKVKPSLVVTEDSNSGFEMIKSIIDCDIISAHGRDNVFNIINNNLNKYNCIYVIVDGAAFGSCIGRIFPRFKDENVYLFAPESFEFLLLLSDTFTRLLDNELIETYNYCDSREFLSWERYYTNLLCHLCKENFDFDYTKSKLHEFFKSDYYKSHIKNQLSDLF